MPRKNEMGPAVILPNGKALVIGGSGETAIYTPPAGDPAGEGSWTPGPNFPLDTTGHKFSDILACIEAPACVLPNGMVLCAAGSVSPNEKGEEDYTKPTILFIFDPNNPQA